ncbi:MAG: cytidylate kinase family protein [Eubacteriales bacterium]
MGFKITLAGDQGSGKSTVSKILIARTGAAYHSTGMVARAYAEKLGMDIAAFNVYSESRPEIDYEIDGALEALGESPQDMIIDSRMAWHFVRGNFAVYLFSDPEVCAERIFAARRATETFPTKEEALRAIRRRKASETKRYRDLYRVVIGDFTNYHLLIDSTYAHPEEVADYILEGLAAWQANPAYRGAYISPLRLYYPDEEPAQDKLSRLTALIERGQTVPPVTVAMREDRYYILDGAESAVACALCGLSFVPFVLTTTGELTEQNFVKMENLYPC